MNKKIKIYVAGPYSNGDTAINVRNAILAGDKILEKGHTPYIPHLSHFHHMICPHEYQRWLDYDIEWLLSCDLMVRLNGYSPGANVEEKKAVNNDIPIFYDMIKLLKFLDDYNAEKLTITHLKL